MTVQIDYPCEHAAVGIPREVRCELGKTEEFCPLCEEEAMEAFARQLVRK